MDIFINRRGGVPVRDQLVTQLELKILGGELTQGQRLPSVRALARRLKVHHNTVSAAYQDLQVAGHVDLRRGSGVFVRTGGPRALAEAMSAHIAMPALAKSLFLNLPTCVFACDDMSCARSLSWSHSAMNAFLLLVNFLVTPCRKRTGRRCRRGRTTR